MREQSRKNGKAEEHKEAAFVPGEKEADKKADKEKIRELARKKKEMQEELDELKGNTAGGKALCALAFFVSLGVLAGIFVGMVKLDVGGVASQMLAPAIADVPVIRSVLPARLQKKNAAELAAEKQQKKAEKAAAKAAKEAKAQAKADKKAQAAAKEAEAQADAEAAAEEAAAEQEAAAEEAAEEEAAALQDYVDTYSAMKPKDAAKVFDSMMPDQESLIARILENLKPDQRAAILSKMSVANAALLTEKMKK